MPLVTCPDCGAQVSTVAALCPNCGRPFNSPTVVNVNNFDVPLGHLVTFLLKLVVAAIPAALLVGAIAALVSATCGRR